MKKRIKGFTLIELLTVIAIIAILAGFTFAILPRVRERAKLRRMDNTFLQFRTAMTSYFTDNNTYPPGYGFVKWDSKDYQVGQISDEQLFMLRPYTALVKVHGDRKYLDEFSDGFDTNRDGRIGLMEFLPIGIKSQATGVYTFPDELYRGNNNPGGELTRLRDMENRPFVYAPVN
ncbi:MAG: type II secretion system protein, partial [Candidatus Hydrogenedens sp.]